MYSLSPKWLNLQMKAMKLNALLKIITNLRQSPNYPADSALPTPASCLFTPVHCHLIPKYDTRIFSSIISYTLKSWWGKPLSENLNFIFKRHFGIAAPNKSLIILMSMLNMPDTTANAKRTKLTYSIVRWYH